MNHWSYLDGRLVPKISKRPFFRDIQISSHGVADIDLEPRQKIFFENISTNMVARGVGSFGTLGDAADTFLSNVKKIFCQSSVDMWWTYAENFRAISWFM